MLDQVRHDRAGDSLEYARVETTYLQLVMRRLWDAESAAGSHRLRIGTLEDLGGASTIIATHLDASMSQLTPAEQGVAATAFRYLVTPTGTKIALAVEDVAELSGVPADDLAAVMRRLAAADLHILRRVAIPDAPDVARYEIFHDALADPISDWRRRFTRSATGKSSSPRSPPSGWRRNVLRPSRRSPRSGRTTSDAVGSVPWSE